MLSKEEFRDNIEEMLRLAATQVPQDVENALKRASNLENETFAKKQLETILQNLEIGKEKKVPICQDTGIPIFFIKMGSEIKLEFNLRETLEDSVRKASESIPLRPNVVDPLTRENSGDNTGEKNPIVHVTRQPGENFEIELMLKGAGSENWSQLFMLNPTAGEEEIKKKTLQVLEKAGGQICPPGIIGLGIGGTADQASYLAKKALLRSLDEENDDEKLAELEEEITNSANELEIGPMGLGGKPTVLGTQIEKAGCHTASLPLAINLQCWAARRARSKLTNGKLQIEVPK